ncbi:alpha/beta hydrolase [Paenibacillus sp. FSL H8-0548]|uniref:alpha/beta hydrolase n=1 Tax=Paenibacillus sp. FSL H8-0548 TaxID=1920422 RepID=UPI00096E8F8D|nr:alpha/beta fold hydrolase [Paenibacillus sp. FSL H8-0548]OMF37846.1 alpha/beta hydrolase [Paenibacillus sp. FSL H8-0548]
MSTTMMTPLPLEGGFPQSLQPFPLGDADKLFQLRKTKSRSKHLLVASITSLIAACLLVVIIFHGYVAWMLAYPYVAPLTSNPQIAIGLDYEDVIFPSKSGDTTVSGWFVPAYEGASEPTASMRTVVFSHGYGANREETWVPMYELTKLLHGLNYNVLLFDYGYASKEYKAPATGGLEESQQLLAAVDYVKARGAEDIVVWGFSMGAGTALQAALQTEAIDAMILDSLFIPSSEALFDNLNQFISLPSFSLPLIESMIPLWTGTSFGSIPASEVISNVYDIPLFIIHGTNDVKAPFQTAEAVSEGQGNVLSRSWIVQDGKHELLFKVHPSEYIQRAALFLSQVDQQLQAERL